MQNELKLDVKTYVGFCSFGLNPPPPKKIYILISFIEVIVHVGVNVL